MKVNVEIMRVSLQRRAYLNVILNFVKNIFSGECDLLIQTPLVLVNYVTQFIVSIDISGQRVRCVGFGMVRLDNIYF